MSQCPKCGHQRQAGEKECPRCGVDFAIIDQKKEMAAAAALEKQKARAGVIGRLNMIIREMSDKQVEALLEQAEDIFSKRDRQYPRIPCLISTDYKFRDRIYSDYIKNISLGGAFIQTEHSFPTGQEILMTLSLAHYHKPFKVTGEIRRLSEKLNAPM